MTKAIFLDRDGTIIVDKNYLNDPLGVEFLPFAIEGLTHLANQGFTLVVVTNQSGVSKGLVSELNIHLIHKKIDELLAIHKVKIQKYYYNTADSTSNDSHRKPNPGMLLDAAKDLNIDMTQSWMIGDRDSDIKVGHNAQVKTIFIVNKTHPLSENISTNYKAKDLLEAALYIEKSSSTHK